MLRFLLKVSIATWLPDKVNTSTDLIGYVGAEMAIEMKNKYRHYKTN